MGSGLAAKHGILARGGGEAFQEASQVDIIVFDKTGTLTEGREPKVTDEIIYPDHFTVGKLAPTDDEKVTSSNSVISGIVLLLASASSHPLCASLRSHFHGRDNSSATGSNIEEIPGCGMKGVVSVTQEGRVIRLKALLGNETWLAEHGAVPNPGDSQLLHKMKSDGKSVTLLATSIHIRDTDMNSLHSEASDSYEIVGLFGIADPIRQEAASVISKLRARNIETWMITGDNAVTARAVARSIGIPLDNVIAGVLPHQKVTIAH